MTLFDGDEPPRECPVPGCERGAYHVGGCGPLFPDPARDGHGPVAGPETSTLAAHANGTRNGSQRHRIGDAYYAHPDGLTDEEAATLAGIRPQSSPWKRCSELREWGFLYDTGTRRLTSSGEQAMVCAFTQRGRDAWRLRFTTTTEEP